MPVERTAELTEMRSDVAIESFVAEHCDRLIGLARLWAGSGGAV